MGEMTSGSARTQPPAPACRARGARLLLAAATAAALSTVAEAERAPALPSLLTLEDAPRDFVAPENRWAAPEQVADAPLTAATKVQSGRQHASSGPPLSSFSLGQGMAQSTLGASAHATMVGLLFPFLGPLKTVMKLCAACVCFAVLFKMFGKMNCGGKKCDPRRCKCLAKQLLATGWDEFEGFEVTVKVHAVADIGNQKDILGGEKEYKVRVQFKWSKFDTQPTKDMKWEATKTLEVPQGASECCIALYTSGRFGESRVGKVELETKKDMLDKDEFWGKKQKMKLEGKGGKDFGKIHITFWRKGGRSEGDDAADGVGGDLAVAEVPIAGLDEDSALATEIRLVVEEQMKTPGYIPPKHKLEGNEKLRMLAAVLNGSLREVNKKGKETGKVYVRMICCNFAELQGDDRQDELVRQKEKAKKKGLQAVETKWYWVWYEDKKKAFDESKWHYPDGFIPLASITAVHSSPERSDQFLIKYSEQQEAKVLLYRRESGKGLDVWVEGIDLAFLEARKELKDRKEQPAKEQQAKVRMQQLHQQFVQARGYPANTEQWQEWTQMLRTNNYPDDLIRKFYAELTSRPAAAAAASASSSGPKKTGGKKR